MTRTDKEGLPEGGWYPEQAVNIHEAVRAYTRWAAFAGFREDLAGTIEVGKWADLTALDIDPFVLAQTDPAALLDGAVVMTVIAGEVAFSAP